MPCEALWFIFVRCLSTIDLIFLYLINKVSLSVHCVNINYVLLVQSSSSNLWLYSLQCALLLVVPEVCNAPLG